MQALIAEKGKLSFCRCFASSTFPLCDGSHNKHNEANGDNAGPAVLSSMGGSSNAAPKKEAAKGVAAPLVPGLKVCRLP